MSDRLITLFLIDDTPIFRLGVASALASWDDLQITCEGDTETVFASLSQNQPDILVIDPGKTGLGLIDRIKQQYPQMRICLFTDSLTLGQLLKAKQRGIEGYCAKGKTSEELVEVLYQIAKQGTSWPVLKDNYQAKNQLKYILQNQFFFAISKAGFRQIEEDLILVNQQTQKSQLSWLDWLFWTGRKRELLAARWLVTQLSPELISLKYSEQNPQLTIGEQQENKVATHPDSMANLPVLSSSQSLANSSVFERVLEQIQLGIENFSNVPLEIDILKLAKRQELLSIVLDNFKLILEEFIWEGQNTDRIGDKAYPIIQQLWENSTRIFLERYYPNKQELREDLIEVILVDELRYIKREILLKIPLTEELLSYLVFKKKLMVERVEYEYHTPEATQRAQLLLENLLIHTSNAVMAVVLNNFAELEELKTSLYNSRLKSSREIAKLRNNLSWRYRKERYWEEPTYVFESKYRLFYLNRRKIQKMFIYAPRQQELERLRGIPFLVTIALEIRDAIAPILRSTINLVGKGLVYILTQVIGRGIGLIGRGIIQGIGNTLQSK